MRRELLHIYGPFSIQSYGLIISLGLMIFMWLIQKDKRYKDLKLDDTFSGIIMVGICAALLGGRGLYIATEGESIHYVSDIFAFWNGGFSILGSVLAVIITVPVYLRTIKVPIVQFFDLIAIYAPLLQGISRIGCFFAGCCHGIATTVAWGVTYTDIKSAAPLYTCMHPTQLYSSMALLSIFALMYFVLQYRCTKIGQLSAAYLLLESSERFFIDFWRGDRPMAGTFFGVDLSSNQLVALGIFGVGCILLFLINSGKTKHLHE